MVRNLRRRLGLLRSASERGYTLIETLVVLSLLLVVIGGVVDGYVSASNTEVDQTARADDQESARQSLERMRRDIHCATSATIQNTTDGSGNITSTTLFLVVPQGCIGVTADTNGQVEWCTASVGGATNHYALYRTISGDCDANDAVFQVDHVIRPDLWQQVCSSVHLQAVAIDLPINRDIDTFPRRTYELTDTISLRNDSVSSGTCT